MRDSRFGKLTFEEQDALWRQLDGEAVAGCGAIAQNDVDAGGNVDVGPALAMVDQHENLAPCADSAANFYIRRQRTKGCADSRSTGKRGDGGMHQVRIEQRTQ